MNILITSACITPLIKHTCQAIPFGQIFQKGAIFLFSAREIIEEGLFGDLEVKDLEMKAGECLIFSSLNMHVSYANTSKDKSRFSFAMRYTANHVKVAPYGKDNISTIEGLLEFTLQFSGVW